MNGVIFLTFYEVIKFDSVPLTRTADSAGSPPQVISVLSPSLP
jgi:hypothetical protein